mgnify:CR=1 FL=1
MKIIKRKIQRKKIQIDLFVSKSCGYDPVLFKDMPKIINESKLSDDDVNLLNNNKKIYAFS